MKAQLFKFPPFPSSGRNGTINYVIITIPWFMVKAACATVIYKHLPIVFTKDKSQRVELTESISIDREFHDRCAVGVHIHAIMTI